jgi:murein DD-endopeptidase MepM/ murein hydrolase activator NlpD
VGIVVSVLLTTTLLWAGELPWIEHRVCAGETPESIAGQYGLEAAELLAANELDETVSVLDEGMLLLVPRNRSLLVATLVEVQRRKLFSERLLENEGRIVAPATDEGRTSMVFPSEVAGSAVGVGMGGDVEEPVRIESAQEEPHPTSRGGTLESFPSQEEENAAMGIPLDQGVQSHGSRLWREHVVVRGETLYALSQRYGVPVQKLASLNALTVEAPLAVGMTLRIPPGEGSSIPVNSQNATPLSLETPPAAMEIPLPAASDKREAEVSKGPLGAVRVELPSGMTVPTRASAMTPLVWPVKGRVVRTFGKEEFKETEMKSSSSGIVIAFPQGNDVCAAAEGKVLQAGWMKGFGNAVFLAHAAGLTTFYGNLEMLYCKPGESVTKGQRIGTAAQGENTQERVLFFHVLKGGKSVDPLAYLPMVP